MLGPAGERTAESAHSPVVREGEAAVPASLEDLRERELEQRQSPRSIGGVRYDLGEQRRFRHHAHAFGRPGDRTLKLLRRQWAHGLRSSPDELAERLVTERPIVEVPAERDHDAYPGPWIHRGGD